jgi:hypothetical protein
MSNLDGAMVGIYDLHAHPQPGLFTNYCNLLLYVHQEAPDSDGKTLSKNNLFFRHVTRLTS